MTTGCVTQWYDVSMKLPHDEGALHVLRMPTMEDPWRVLISGCLFGWKVAVDGGTYGLDGERPKWLDSPLVEMIPFCPEDYRLGTPRTMPDLHGGDGVDVLSGKAKVLDPDGVDLTAQVIAGAEAMAQLAKERKVDFAFLTDRSGACGSQVISVGCRFVEPIEFRKGVGVATACLLREGIPIVSHRDHRTLDVLRSKVDIDHSPDPSLLDHHQHPWVIENLS